MHAVHAAGSAGHLSHERKTPKPPRSGPAKCRRAAPSTASSTAGGTNTRRDGSSLRAATSFAGARGSCPPWRVLESLSFIFNLKCALSPKSSSLEKLFCAIVSPQRFQRMMEPGFHGAEGHLHRLGNFRQRESVHIPQQQHLAMFLR